MKSQHLISFLLRPAEGIVQGLYQRSQLYVDFILTEGMMCRFRYPTRAAGCTMHLAVPKFIKAESSMFYFDTNMKKEEGREVESNSKIIKVVKTCYSGRIEFSPLF